MEKIKAFSRYKIIDDFTLEELKGKYLVLDTKGKSDLFKSFTESKETIPFEISEMTTSDNEVDVRRWLVNERVKSLLVTF